MGDTQMGMAWWSLTEGHLQDRRCGGVLQYKVFLGNFWSNRRHCTLEDLST